MFFAKYLIVKCQEILLRFENCNGERDIAKYSVFVNLWMSFTIFWKIMIKVWKPPGLSCHRIETESLSHGPNAVLKKGNFCLISVKKNPEEEKITDYSWLLVITLNEDRRPRPYSPPPKKNASIRERKLWFVMHKYTKIKKIDNRVTRE